jgi:hypothetical protein
VLITSRLSLIIVAATIGLEFGFITEALKDSIIRLAVVTCLVGPSLFNAMHRLEEDTLAGGPEIEKKRVLAGWTR